MTHLEPGDIQSWIHGEGDGSAQRARNAAHLRNCADCREAVDAADREDAWVRARLATLDAAPPHRSGSIHAASRPTAASRPAWRIAATIALMVLGGSLLYAAPASRRWIMQRLGGATPPSVAPTPPTTTTTPTPPNAAVVPAVGGISVVPGGDYAVLVMAPEAVRLRVRSTRRPELSVTTTGAHATFESRPGSMLVRSSGPLLVDVEAPAGAARVVVRLNGRAAATVTAGRLSRPGRDGQERLGDQWRDVVP